MQCFNFITIYSGKIFVIFKSITNVVCAQCVVCHHPEMKETCVLEVVITLVDKIIYYNIYYNIHTPTFDVSSSPYMHIASI